MAYRHLTDFEISEMKRHLCDASSWDNVLVTEDFNPKYVVGVRFSGVVRLGSFKKVFSMPGGMLKHSGVFHSTLHNVTIGNDCCIENVKNFISNYVVGDDTFIENVDVIVTDGASAFGNGVEVAVLNETGGREVRIHDHLSAHEAYMAALYRHRPKMIEQLNSLIDNYVGKVTSTVGYIGKRVTITDTGYLKNVKVGDYCKIEGAARLKNGSINSNALAPVHIGVGVIGDDFIIQSGAKVEDSVMFSKCFIGQSCILGHSYSATNSLFFCNCHGENGEACSIFAGPYTVSHHKSTLLISGMFSFMNAGSGSNQSNHLYKLGPIHQGIMERGSKTASDSYILWPAKVGAFTLVMGRHTSNQDTSNLPFSYLIEQQGYSYIIPGANLRSVGTIRDTKKWPKRDNRTDESILDSINYNLLSPYTVQKMLNGLRILEDLKKNSGVNTDVYTYHGARIKNFSLNKGLTIYRMAITKFLGNSLIKRLETFSGNQMADVYRLLEKEPIHSEGDWVDVSGLIAPKSEIERVMGVIEDGTFADISLLYKVFADIHANYYRLEWNWAYSKIEEFFGVDLRSVSAKKIVEIVNEWREAVVGIDNMLYEDAKKEFSLAAMTGFGADGDSSQMAEDFTQVRGGEFHANPFVKDVTTHIEKKSALGQNLIDRLALILEK